MADDLKYIVINDEPYLVEEVVYDWHLSLSKENESLYEVLQEISEGKGAFNTDQLKHASNCIDDMKALAVAALKNKEDK